MFDTPDTSYSESLLDDLDDLDAQSLDAQSLDTQAPDMPATPDAGLSLLVAPDNDGALSGLYSSERVFPCNGRTQLFFAPPGERRVRREKREATARSYCNQCSAKEMCKLAGRAGREHGIWGGENDEERAAAGYAPMFPHRKAIVRAAQDAKRRPPLSA